jgi:hypothetical protein
MNEREWKENLERCFFGSTDEGAIAIVLWGDITIYREGVMYSN